MSEINFVKFFPIEKERLFNYFAQKDLVEKWQVPSGMTLKLPKFEAQAGGAYRYEHKSADGLYICEGYFKEFNHGERIVQFDKFIKDPKGDIIFENLESAIDFLPRPGGTEVRIRQSGFTNGEQSQMCQDGWVQSLELLTDLVSKDAGIQAGRTKIGDERERRI